MNPSTEELVRSIENSRYNKVILLPNNKNVILAAQQARDLTKKEVLVVPSKSIPRALPPYWPLTRRRIWRPMARR